MMANKTICPFIKPAWMIATKCEHTWICAVDQIRVCSGQYMAARIGQVLGGMELGLFGVKSAPVSCTWTSFGPVLANRSGRMLARVLSFKSGKDLATRCARLRVLMRNPFWLPGRKWQDACNEQQEIQSLLNLTHCTDSGRFSFDF